MAMSNADAEKRMKSFGLLSVNLEPCRSSNLTALFNCGCKYVRALKVVFH